MKLRQRDLAMWAAVLGMIVIALSLTWSVLRREILLVAGRIFVEELIVSTFVRQVEYDGGVSDIEQICSTPLERYGLYYVCELSTRTSKQGQTVRVTQVVRLYAFANRGEAEKRDLGKAFKTFQFIVVGTKRLIPGDI